MNCVVSPTHRFTKGGTSGSRFTSFPSSLGKLRVFSDLIYERLSSKVVSIRKLAAAAKCDYSAMHSCCSGLRIPNQETLAIMERLLGPGLAEALAEDTTELSGVAQDKLVTKGRPPELLQELLKTQEDYGFFAWRCARDLVTIRRISQAEFDMAKGAFEAKFGPEPRRIA
jgi:hypothetical protein